MGSIVGAALVSHVPPLVMPESERRALNGGEDTSLFAGLHALRGRASRPPPRPTPWWWSTPTGSPPSST